MPIRTLLNSARVILLLLTASAGHAADPFVRFDRVASVVTEGSVLQVPVVAAGGGALPPVIPVDFVPGSATACDFIDCALISPDSWVPSPIRNGAFTLSVRADNLVEGTESAKFLIRPGVGYLLSDPLEHYVTILSSPPAVLDLPWVSVKSGVSIEITIPRRDPSACADSTAPARGNSVLVRAAHGTESLESFPLGSGRFGYRSNAGYIGDDEFIIRSSVCCSAPEVNCDVVDYRVRIHVTPENVCPAVAPLTQDVDENGRIEFNLAATDADGDALIFTPLVPPAHARTFTVSAEGQVVYEPATDYNGPDSFDYEVSDGRCPVRGTVTVRVVPKPSCPTVAPLAVELAEDGTATFPMPATDPDGDGLTYRVAAQPAHGTVTVDPATGIATFRPEANYHGTERFEFEVSDGVCTKRGEIGFTVQSVNDCPTASDQRVFMEENGEVVVQIGAVDADGDAVTTAFAQEPRNFTVTAHDPATGEMRLKAVPGACGTEQVTVRLNDGQADPLCDAHVTWTVQVGRCNGLLATFYEEPDFSGASYQMIVPNVDYDSRRDGPPHPQITDGTYSVRYEGQIEIPVAGDYYLGGDHAGAFGISIDGGPFFSLGQNPEHDRPDTAGSFLKRMELGAGRHDISIYYADTKGLALVGLHWAVVAPDYHSEIVPTESLFPPPRPPACAPLPSGLVAWWPGEGNADDALGRHSGTLQEGAISNPLGFVGHGFELDGLGAHVAIPHSAAFDFAPEGAFSISAWVRPFLSFDRQAILVKSPASGAWDWGLYLDVDGTFMAGSRNGDAVRSRSISGLFLGHHVVATYANRHWDLYVDGVLEATESGTAILQSNGGLAIGRKGDVPTHAFMGMIDEVAVFDRVLTEAEVKAAFEAGEAGHCRPGLYLASHENLPEGVVAEPYQFTLEVAMGTPPYATTVTGGALPPSLTLSATGVLSGTPSRAGDFQFEVEARDAGGRTGRRSFTLTISEPCARVPAGALAWWRGEGTAEDAWQLSSGVLKNGATFAPGKVGRAFRFDGVDDYVEVPDNPRLRLAGGVTVEAWVRWTRGSSRRLILSQLDQTFPEFRGFELALNTQRSDDTRIELAYGGIGNGGRFSVPFPFQANQWVHLATSFDPDTRKACIYANGQQINSWEMTESLSAVQDGHGPLVIGKGHGFWPGDDLQLLVDEPAIYDRALSAAEIAAIYRAGKSGKCFPPPPPANLVFNGSFEQFVVPEGGQRVGGPAGRTLPGWEVSSPWPGILQFPSSLAPVTDGNQAVEFALVGDGVRQTISTEPARAYELALDVALNAGAGGAGPSIPAIRVVVADQDVTLQVQRGTYSRHTIPFVASATTTVLRVQDAWHHFDIPDDDLLSVDNVVVTEVPACAPLPAGAVGWWLGEDTAADALALNPGTLRNGITFAPGLVGRAFSFDAAGAGVEVPDSPRLNVTGALTVEAWIYPRLLSGISKTILSKENSAGDGFWFGLGKNVPGLILTLQAGSLNTRAISIPYLDASTWMHVAGTFDPATQVVSVYLNGLKVPVLDEPHDVVPALPDTGAPLTIGGGGFNGLVDEPAIYNRALSAEEIAGIYRAGRAGKCAPALRLSPAPPEVPHGGTTTLTAVGGQAPYTFDLADNRSGGSLSADGTYTAGRNCGPDIVDTVRVTDAAGAAATAAIRVWDRTAPVLECPADITVTATGPDGATVALSPPPATDECGPVTITFQWPDNTPFPLGTTRVTVEAADSSGNRTACTFNVIVQPAGTHYTWTRAVDYDWWKAANWSPHGVPGPNDTATIEFAPNENYQAVFLSGDISVRTLNLNSGGVLRSGTFHGTLNWSGGAFAEDGQLTLAPDATLNILPGGAKSTNYRYQIANAGRINWHDSLTTIEGPIFNRPGGVMILDTDRLVDSVGNALHNDAGARLRVTRSLTLPVHMPLTTAGEVEVTGGTLTIENLLTSTGSWLLPAGAGLTTKGGADFAAGTRFDGPGPVTLAGGVTFFHGEATAPNLVLAGSTVRGGLALKGKLEWISGLFSEDAVLSVLAGSTVNLLPGADKGLIYRSKIYNAGTFNWDVPLTAADGEIFNLGGGVMHLRTERLVTGAGGPFKNEREAKLKVTTSVTLPANMPFTTAGEVEVTGGTLTIENLLTSTGSWLLPAGAGLTTKGGADFAAGTRFDGPGPVTLAGGVTFFHGEATAPNLVLAGSAVRGGLALKGQLDWSSGMFNQDAVLSVLAGSTVNLLPGPDKGLIYRSKIYNAGTFNWDVPLTATDGFIYNQAGGLMVLRTETPLSGGGSGPVENQAGAILQVRDLTGTVHWPVSLSLDNRGTLEVLQGILRLPGDYAPKPGSQHRFGIADKDAGTGYGRLAVVGTASLNGQLEAVLAGGFKPQVGDVFELVTHGARAGTFADPRVQAGLVTFTPDYRPMSVALVVSTVSDLAVSPVSVTVAPGVTVDFAASGGTPPRVFNLKQAPSGGTITSDGHYTAGSVPGADLVEVIDALGAWTTAAVAVEDSIEDPKLVATITAAQPPTITWSRNARGWVLEHAPSLVEKHATTWTSVAVPEPAPGLPYSFTPPLASERGFFRLRKVE